MGCSASRCDDGGLSRSPRNHYGYYTALSPEDCTSLPVSEQKKTYGHSQGVGRLAEEPQRWSRIHWHGGRPGQGFGSRSARCSSALIASTCPCTPPCSADHLVPTAGRPTHSLQFPSGDNLDMRCAYNAELGRGGWTRLPRAPVVHLGPSNTPGMVAYIQFGKWLPGYSLGAASR
jgi:hypothetical protein